VLPKRWVVERTFGWINRARRLAKDFEATIESSLAWLLIALAFFVMPWSEADRAKYDVIQDWQSSSTKSSWSLL
jgi:hypothetical protein